MFLTLKYSITYLSICYKHLVRKFLVPVVVSLLSYCCRALAPISRDCFWRWKAPSQWQTWLRGLSVRKGDRKIPPLLPLLRGGTTKQSAEFITNLSKNNCCKITFELVPMRKVGTESFGFLFSTLFLVFGNDQRHYLISAQCEKVIEVGRVRWFWFIIITIR